jgi:hypothetical protein
MILPINKSIFIKCKCGDCNILELMFDDEYGEFNVTIWNNHSGKNIFSKSERIRWCENVMKTGNPWADHTIVSIKDALRISKFINKKLTQYGKKKVKRKYGRTSTSTGE